MKTKTIDRWQFTEMMGLAARQAGAVANQFFGKVQNIGKSVDREFVNDLHQASLEALSDIDLATQEVILLALAEYFPFVRLEPEETTPTVERFAANRSRYSVVVDPIDGTLNYLSNKEHYAVAIGLVENVQYVASVVYFPAQGTLYRAVRDEGCRVQCDGRTRRAGRAAAPDVVFRDAAASESMIQTVETLGYSVVRSGSSIVDTTCVATGAARAAVYQRQPSIRRCIGALISREAGGFLTDMHGRTYDCTWPDTLDSLLVARERKTGERLLSALAPEVSIGRS